MKKMGRPKSDTEAVTLRLSKTAIEAVDEARRSEPDLPTRPEMIRRILAAHFAKEGLELDE